MRNTLRVKAIKEMEDKANYQRIKELVKSTHCNHLFNHLMPLVSIDELEKLYAKMCEYSANFSFNETQFINFTQILVPWLRVNLQKLFKVNLLV